MNTITIKGLNHFTESSIEKLYSNILGVPIKPTVSLCHHCHSHIPAWRYHSGGKVYIVKNCSIHGISHHMIESDLDFYNQLECSYEDPRFNFNGGVLIEGSDRCNLECPHCYHEPDNKIKDPSILDLKNQVSNLPLGEDKITRIILAGAEPSLRPDFSELVYELNHLNLSTDVSVMTNGIRFADKKFTKEAKQAGLAAINVGLNHPTYINHKTIRRKQELAIENIQDVGIPLSYISYTMYNFTELNDILNEITSNNWIAKNFRIRYGSDIGRNPGQKRLYVSDIFKATREWCEKNNKEFKLINPADNNIYHVMVQVDNKTLRLIQWCDETDINLEDLRSGPWCNFVPDGVTNFLHQIIRRDIWKNQNIILPDSPPERYLFNSLSQKDPLNLLSLI